MAEHDGEPERASDPSDAKVEALNNAKAAMLEISKHMQPILQTLQNETHRARVRVRDSPSIRNLRLRRRQVAQAATALTLGTMRYVGARLRGLDQGRKASDPLRQELNRARQMLMEAQKEQAEAFRGHEGTSQRTKSIDNGSHKKDFTSKTAASKQKRPCEEWSSKPCGRMDGHVESRMAPERKKQRR